MRCKSIRTNCLPHQTTHTHTVIAASLLCVLSVYADSPYAAPVVRKFIPVCLPENFLLPVFQPHALPPSELLSIDPMQMDAIKHENDRCLALIRSNLRTSLTRFPSRHPHFKTTSEDTVDTFLDTHFSPTLWRWASSHAYSRLFVHPATHEHFLVPGIDYCNHADDENQINGYVRHVAAGCGNRTTYTYA